MAFHRRRSNETEDPVVEEEILGFGAVSVALVNVRWDGAGC